MAFLWSLTLACTLSVAGAAFTYEDLGTLIRERHLTTIDQVIGELPEAWRGNFALMRDSASLQPGTPLAPRVILFGEDASLILAFNGDRAKKGFDQLETIQYRETTHRFEFYRITFPAERGQPGAPIFSAKNPPLCLTCHGREPRPNWGEYNRWAGAYGELDDFPQLAEAEPLSRFFSAVQSVTPRYRHLRRLPGSDLSPYETKMRGRLRFRPNFRFSALTFARTARRNLALLEQDARFQRARYLFAMSRLGCRDEALDWSAELKRIFGGEGAAPLKPWAEPTLDNLYAYILRDLGVSRFAWTTAFAPYVPPFPQADPYFFHCGIPKGDLGHIDDILTMADLVVQGLLAKLAARDAELRPFLRRSHWIRERFKDDAGDGEMAARLDEAFGMLDGDALTAVCPLLYRRHAHESATRPDSRPGSDGSDESGRVARGAAPE